MTISIATTPLAFTCGKCGHKETVLLGRLEQDLQIKCSACGQIADADPEQLRVVRAGLTELADRLKSPIKIEFKL